jgi:type IV pilus assembly protein PilB
VERKPLGQILKEKGYLTDQALNFALLEQKATGEKLGEILIRMGITTDLEIAVALAEQANLPFVDLTLSSLIIKLYLSFLTILLSTT